MRRAFAERPRAEMDAKVRARCAEDVPGDTYRHLEVAAIYTDQTFKHTLLPVWLLHYDYGRKAYEVVDHLAQRLRRTVRLCSGT